MSKSVTLAAGVAVGAVVYGIFKRFFTNLQDEINRQEKCAVCNLPLTEYKVILRCQRHAVHEGCKETLLAEGQERCPVCPNRF